MEKRNNNDFISSSIEHALIVFVKNPQLGKAKTRIAKDVGDIKALKIYLQLVDKVKELISNLSDISVFVFYSAFIEKDHWPEAAINRRIQSGTDLGLRMSNAFDEVFKTHDKVCIIGSDCPYITKNHILQAFHLLDEHEICVGPCYDGGYYLLGMDQFYPYLFNSIEWSTEKVTEQTLNIAKEKGLQSIELEKLNDIDFISDWHDFLASKK